MGGASGEAGDSLLRLSDGRVVRQVSVTIGGKAAAVYFTSPTQIDVQAPSNLPLGDAAVVVTNNGLVSASFTTTVVASSPSFLLVQRGHELVGRRGSSGWNAGGVGP